MIKKLMLILAILLLSCSFASAEKAAYVVKNNNNAEQKYIGILENMSFEVDIIDSSLLNSMNFSNYSLLLVNDNYFSNAEKIPVNQMPSVILNTWNIDVFHWSASSGQLASSGILQAYINNPNHTITKGFPSLVNVFFSSGLSYNYLPKRYKALALKTIASLPSDHSDVIIAAAEPGTKLRDNVYSNARGVFFGIGNHNNWTNYTEQLFRNSVRWVSEDFVPPVILGISAEDITNQSAKIVWVTDKQANSIVFYGYNLNLSNAQTDNSLVENHFVDIDNLDELTTYYYKVRSCNKDNYCTNSSVYSFNTVDITPPGAPKNLILEVINDNNDIKVKWGASDGGAAAYNIYIADSLDGFDFENPSTSLVELEYTDSGASDAKQRYYVVRAEDESGNEEKNENIAAKFDLNLVKGYNLVAIPLTPFDNNVSKVMHQDETYNPVSIIKRFDSLSQAFQTIDCNESTNKWSNEFGKLHPLEGYFLKSDKALNFTIVGYPLETSIDFVEGMNLVGITLFEDKQIGEVIIQSPFGYNVTEISSRNLGGDYNIATYYNSTDSWFNGFGIKQGVGYWVKANKNFSLKVEP